MGLLDYYKQFEDMEEEEVNRALRERRKREKELALEEVPVIDLSSTEWPDFPHSEVVNASIFVARGRLNGYPDRYATEVRRRLAERHEIAPEQVVVGNGVAELLQASAFALLGAGDELSPPWPSYPLYPLMAARAGARPGGGGRRGRRRRSRCAAGGGHRAHARAGDLQPERPDGRLHRGRADRRAGVAAARARDRARGRGARALPGRGGAAMPRSGWCRASSGCWCSAPSRRSTGCPGLRAGYAVGSPSSASLLERIAPVLGVNALTQAAVVHALKIADRDVEQRRAAVLVQRDRLFDALQRHARGRHAVAGQFPVAAAPPG